ncbi:cation:proton antiporter, partial [Streptomyces phaeochromogenes]
GEFSIVIAGLAVTSGIEPRLGPLATAYVLILVIVGPLTARFTEPVATRLTGRSRRSTTTVTGTPQDRDLVPSPDAPAEK